MVEARRDASPPADKEAQSSDDDTQSSDSDRVRYAACEPCQQIRFTFGRSGQYYFHTDDHEKIHWTNELSKNTQFNLGSFQGGTRRIYTAAIAADGGILVAGKSDEGDPVLRYAGPMGADSSFELAYKGLWDSITAKGYLATESDASHLRVAFGPRGSYFCATKDEPLWRDIPADLQGAIADSPPDKKARQVALGVHDSWVCVWSDHSHSASANLGSHYPDLARRLDRVHNSDAAGDRMAFVALHPWTAGSWLVADCDGQIAWNNAGGGRSGAEAIQEVSLGYMQRRARRTGLTFASAFSVNNSQAEMLSITPQTRHDASARAASAALGWQSSPVEAVSGRLRLLRDGLPRRLVQPDAVLAGAVCGSTVVVCKMAGVRLGTALNAGLAAGCVAFGLAQHGFVDGQV